MMLEQERRHWLLKTSAINQVQDKITGDMFRGRIENLGSDIIVETEKLPTTDVLVHDGTFSAENVSDVFEIAKSGLPFIPKLNGLHFTRLTSINLMTSPDVYHNFRFVLRNCEAIYVPISSDDNSPNVFVYKWLRTTTPPILQAMDSNNQFTINADVDIRIYHQLSGTVAPKWAPNRYYGKNADGYYLTASEPGNWDDMFTTYYTKDTLQNGAYYYPLDTALQKIQLDEITSLDEVTSALITDETLIGSPVIWFTCDDMANGPSVTLNDVQTSSPDDVSLLLEMGHAGNQTNYRQKIYPACGNEDYVAPSGTIDQWSIICRPKEGTFTNTPADFDVPIGDIIFAENPAAPGDGRVVTTTGSVGSNIIKMSANAGWEYLDENGYVTSLDTFITNPYNQQTEPLIAAFDVLMDTKIPFEKTSTDAGYAGIRFGSAKNDPEQQPRYPHDITNLEGLPDWLTSGEASPQHMAVYALHDTPSYNPEDQSTRQIAGLIFDPGVERQYNTDYHPGQYEITVIDIADGGEGYQADDVVWMIFNSGNRSSTLVQIVSVGANGTVTAVSPVYWDEGSDPVMEPESHYEETYNPAELIGMGLSTVPNTIDDRSSTAGTGLKVTVQEHYITEKVPPFSEGDIPVEEMGRVYVISNDGIDYVNNGRAAIKRPERTLARICDIPTSVMQLSGISGLAPTSIVDKKYIRSYASINEDDVNRIRNGLHDRWVRPIHVDSEAHPIYVPGEEGSNSNTFVFDSMELLRRVDLYTYNDFRSYSNLNPMVTVSDVEVETITNSGSGYTTESYGVLVVGGFSYTYHVDAVNAIGGVTSVTIYPAEGRQSDQISLSNFDIIGTGDVAVTAPYGTSPLGSTSGTGLKLRLRINNYNDLKPIPGEVFDDLFAFAEEVDGIWFCTYDVTGRLWKKIKLVAEKNTSETISTRGYVSTRDAYLNSIIPSLRSITVGKFDDMAETPVYAYKTASAINVIDPDKTPVWIPDAYGDGLIDSKTVVDINKLYCRGLQELHAASRTWQDVVVAIKEAKLDRFDCFIIWRWLNPNDVVDTHFECGILHRSLDNLFSTDATSQLPENQLSNPHYVHTNAQTTVMWNVEHVGPMIWMYNPDSVIHEKYYVNAHTRDLYVTRESFDWEKIQVVNTVNDIERPIQLVNPDGSLAFNILTNNPAFFSADEWPNDPDVIYQQPDFKQLGALTYGSTTYNQYRPRGSWQLVFPDVHAFKIRHINGAEYPSALTPVRMNILRGANLNAVQDVTNEEGIPVNYKTLLMSENTQTRRIEPKAYNQETGMWEII